MTSIVNTLGAGSGVDTAALVTNLVAASREAKDTANTSATTKVTAQITGISTLKSGVTNFSTALKSLIDGGTLKTSPTSSNGAVVDVATIAGTTMASASSSITVSQLAAAQSVAAPVMASADTALGTGSLTFSFGAATMAGTSMTGFAAKASPAAVTIDVTSTNNTLTGIAAAINARNAGLTATVVTDASGARLVVKGATGEASAFTVAAAGDGGAPAPAGLAQLAFGPGTSNSTVTQTAADAIVSVDGVSVHRSSNTVSDLITGVKLTLKSVSTTAISIDATRPTAAITEAVTDFVTAYNGLQAVIAEQTDKDTGTLNGDSSVRQMQQLLSRLTSTALAPGGHPATLAEIGVSTNRDGTLSLDTDKLSAALSSTPDQVEAMFNPSQTSSSALVRIVSANGAATAGTHTISDLVPATAGRLAGGAATAFGGGALVLDATNNVFHVSLDGKTAVDVTVPAGSYADGAAFATALSDAIAASTIGSNHVTTGWSAGGALTADSTSLGAVSAIAITAADAALNGALGLDTAIATAGTKPSATIDGKPAQAVGSLLFADQTSTAKGLTIQALPGAASSATIDVGLGLYSGLQNVVDQLTGSSGALYTAGTRLTKQQADLATAKTKIDDDADALKTRLTQQFAAMDSKVAAYKSTQSFLTAQIAAWNKSDS